MTVNFRLILGYGLLSMLCYSGILDVLLARMPEAGAFVASLFLLTGPPLLLVHGTTSLTAYFVATGILCALAMASWALQRRDPVASIVLLMLTCLAWIGSAVLSVGMAV
jgi:hypothetical protein